MSFSAPSTPQNNNNNKAVASTIVAYCILIRKNGHYGARVPIKDQHKLIFGRDEHCDIRIQVDTIANENTIITLDPNKQAWIDQCNDDYNCAETKLNGKLLRRRKPLFHGTEISIGSRVFRFEYVPEFADKFTKSTVQNNNEPIQKTTKKRHHRRHSSSVQFESNIKIKRRENRERVLREIIDTESTYVSNLRILMEYYVKPLKHMAKHGVFKQVQIDSLFANIQSIYKFHCLFYEEISKPENFNVNSCAMTFLRFSDYLKIYTSYVQRYKQILNTINTLRGQKKFAAFLNERKNLPECKNLDLMSFMIMPVQRIPRYELLLLELTKYVEPDDTTTIPPNNISKSSPPSPSPSPLTLSSQQQCKTKISPLDSIAIDDIQRERATSITVGRILNISIRHREASMCSSISDTDSQKSFLNTSDSSISFHAYSSSIKRNSIHINNSGPMARLQLALTKIKEIAKYVNENSINVEILSFDVLKLNKFNKDSPRTFILDSVQKLLFVEKTNKNTGTQYRDFHLTREQMIKCTYEHSSNTRLILVFFKTSNRLLRNQKEWRLEFQTEGERERFYRLIQIHLLPRHRESTAAVYRPQTIQVTDFVMNKVMQLPLKQLAKEIHQEWLHDRFSQNWQYGAIYDEILKTDPSLLPYDELDDDRKSEHMLTVRETLGCVYQLGFKITKLSLLLSTATTVAPELFQLVEYLAENVHDSWAKSKMSQGWKYDEQLNSNVKTHPLLVPYCDIPGYEQDFARANAKKIISSLLDLGYNIEKDREFTRRKTTSCIIGA